MNLIIDSREVSALSDEVESKATSMNIITKKQWIEVGDYVIGNTCFEAKSTHDFLSSVISKRLWTQLDNMDRCYDNNIVIIYGSLRDALTYTKYSAKYNSMPRNRKMQLLTNKFYGALGRIILDSDIKPVWVLDEFAAASIICSVAKMQPVDRPPIKPHMFKRFTTDDVRINMLTTVKGVSEKKAKMLIKKYGSLMEIGDCDKRELCSLEGIGDTTADRILSIFNSEKKVIQ
jgi:ERCC4-type nuclease|tara:strand:- start:715 stop:1410 length:696 start_codon:yes stop_codon:yes gene_type:complete